MTDNDIKTICEKIESLHEKILKSKFAETVTESEMLSLILAVKELNRQKAEIEAYKHYYNECLNDLKNAHVEIEELREINDCRTRDMPLFYATAIQDFAKRLKEKMKTPIGTFYGRKVYNSTNKDIDDLVKEMTEGEDERC